MSVGIKASNDAAASANADASESGNESASAATTANASETSETAGQLSARLLKESKAFKERAMKAEKELEALRKTEQEATGKFKELYESTKTELDTVKKQNLKSKIEGALRVAAAKAGCVDLDAVMALGDKSLLEYDEATGELAGDEDLIHDLKKRKPYLFQTVQAPTVNPTTPGGVVKNKPLSAADIAAEKDPVKKQALWMQVFGGEAS